MASHKLHVAVAGYPFRGYSGAFEPQPVGIPYQERLATDIEADDTDTLAAVLDRAAAKLGIRPLAGEGKAKPLSEVLAYVAFHQKHDEDLDHFNEVTWLHSFDLTVVGADGRLRWEQKLDQVTVADLIRTSEKGLLPGNPLELYLLFYGAIGNGVYISWEIVSAALNGALQVFTIAAAVEGGLALWERLRTRFARASAALDENRANWGERRAKPHNFDAMMRRRDVWNGEELAEMLDCPLASAEAMLGVWGFEQSESGLWRRSDSEESRFASEVLQEIPVSWSLDPTQGEAKFRQRIEHRIATGEAAPLPTYEPEEEYVPEDDYEGGERAEGTYRLDTVSLRCDCDDESCGRTLTFEHDGAKLRLAFSRDTDHFVVDTNLLGMLLMGTSEAM